MKVDEGIREKLVEARRDTEGLFGEIFDRYGKALNEAASVEHILSAKKALLIELIKNLPMGYAHCYFCYAHHYPSIRNCKECDYSKEHRECNHSNSDFSSMFLARTNLLAKCEHYYSGETYKDPEPEKLKYLPGDVWKVTDPLLTHLRSAFILEYPYLGNEKIALAYLIHRDGYIEISTILIQHIKQRIYNQAATINRSDNEDAG